ncbi:MAG: transporter [Nitrospirae bacterium]|nr:MAG: transporter [Nitrospirota bacterium]
MFKQIMLVLTIIVTIAGTAFAAHPLITDDTGTQGKGKFQVELNGGYGHNRDDGKTTRTTQISTTLTYGFSDIIDVIVSLPYQQTRVEDAGQAIKGAGISDMTIESKWRFYEKEGLSFDLKPGVTLPTGNEKKGLGSGRATYHLFFIASNELKPWAFHVNLGYVRNENNIGETKNLWHASFATTIDIAENLKVVGNIGAERDTDRNLNIPDSFVLGGLIYSVSKNFDIDLGIKGGITKPETDYTVLTGITWKF